MAFSRPNPTRDDFPGRVWYFAECKFDELSHELRVRDELVDLESKPLEVLRQLLLKSGDTIRKEELLEAVWPDLVVVDASLATAVSKLRKALGDESIIKTVSKVGYRISVPVRCEVRRPTLVESSSPKKKTPPSDLATIPNTHSRRFSFLKLHKAWLVSFVLLAAAAIGFAAFHKRSKASLIPGPVAILPFQNVDSTPGLDYLKSALPDEVAATLSAARSLSIRPLASTSRYSGSSVDLRQAARDLSVNRLITGHFALVGDQLQITMEAIDTDANRVLWHDTVNVPANNLLALQGQVARMSRGKLAGALGIRDFVKESEPPPNNEEAYELYLRSLSLDWDTTPNQQAIALLRKSVALDPAYAPAWGMLSLRYYRDARFSGGGPAMLQLSDAAAERQLSLDPDSPDAVAELTVHLAERGEIVKAHLQAQELLRRRPDSPNNHHAMSYVLRYGGSLEEAGRECDLVTLLATKIIWGSCSTTFMELGNYSRAMDFVRKDLSSEWSKAQAIEVLLRAGKTQEAIRIGPPQIPHWDSYKMLLACARRAPATEIAMLATHVEAADDPEVNYVFAAHLAYCGQTQAAIQTLDSAIKANYCSYPAMDKDPFFDKLRSNSDYSAVRAAAITCHENFVANREQPTHLTSVQNSSQNNR